MYTSRWRRSIRLRAIVVISISFISASVATWPLVLKLSTAVPLGTEHEATVPLFDIWALWWTADRAKHGFAGYLNAPIFYPYVHVTTYSEPLPLIGLLVSPLWYVATPPALIYNIALLFVLTLNGIFAYRLASSLNVPWFSALIGSILIVTLPFIAKVYGVLPNIALFGMLWTLEGLVRFGKTGTIRWALWAVAGFVSTYYSMQQYALFFAPFTITAGLVALSDQGFRLKAVVRLATAGLVAGLVILPLAVPTFYTHAKLGFYRRNELVQALSATPSNFITRPATAKFPFPAIEVSDTGGLFPGVILLILVGLGLAEGMRNPQQRRWVIYLAATTIVAFLLALGLNLNLGGWQPFATLRAIVPGLTNVRSPFRYAAIVQMCLAILATIGLSRIGRGVQCKRNVLVIVVVLLGAYENLTVPVPLASIPHSPQTSWTRWLRNQPDLTVVHIPFPRELSVGYFELETWRMFAQIDHQKPLVNGYSSNFPQDRSRNGEVIPTYFQFYQRMVRNFPNQELLCDIKKLGATTLVIDQRWLVSHRRKMDKIRIFVNERYSDEKVVIYSLELPNTHCSL
jgi:hypothetical protein